jgi:hypothetical protein
MTHKAGYSMRSLVPCSSRVYTSSKDSRPVSMTRRDRQVVMGPKAKDSLPLCLNSGVVCTDLKAFPSV